MSIENLERSCCDQGIEFIIVIDLNVHVHLIAAAMVTMQTCNSHVVTGHSTGWVSLGALRICNCPVKSQCAPEEVKKMHKFFIYSLNQGLCSSEGTVLSECCRLGCKEFKKPVEVQGSSPNQLSFTLARHSVCIFEDSAREGAF